MRIFSDFVNPRSYLFTTVSIQIIFLTTIFRSDTFCFGYICSFSIILILVINEPIKLFYSGKLLRRSFFWRVSKETDI